MNNIPTPHITAEYGKIAKKVLMPGDPLRAKFIAEEYLQEVECFNTVRNIDKAIMEMANKIKEFLSQNLDKKYYLAVVYKRDINLLEKIKEMLKDEISNAQMFIQCDIVTPAVGVHSGFGAIGMCVYAYKG